MKRAAALALLSLAACPPATTVKPDPVPAGRPDATVVITSELRGYLGPCGCSENMRGGIARAAAQLEKVRAEGQPVFFVDDGDGLFGAEQLPEEAVPQQERKAQALAEALTAMKLDARQPGPLDDARGAAFRTARGLPELTGPKVLEREGFKLGLVPGASAAELKAGADQARAKGAQFVLGLFKGTLDAANEQAAASGVDLLIASRAKDEVAGEQSRLLRGEVPVAQVQSKGRSLVRVDLWKGSGEKPELLRGASDKERELVALDERIEQLRAQTNEPGLAPELRALKQAKLTELEQRRANAAAEPPPAPKGQRAFAVRFVPLESSFPEDPKVKALVDAYDHDVGELNLAWAKKNGHDCPAPKKGEPGFVGNAACLDCHKEALPVWQASKHAHGLATLQEKGKQYHLDCVACHVTGWQRAGGVCRIDKTQGREGIGCESCHGPGSVHADEPSEKNIGAGNDPKACVGCHDRENSPHFDFDKYVKQILGPGHGQL
ncbi:MAG: cytochrome C [Archangiaceae bacterium]|nr:cytochrome C [Archangiaceae bacterium]